jgi:hypothetical protein
LFVVTDKGVVAGVTKASDGVIRAPAAEMVKQGGEVAEGTLHRRRCGYKADPARQAAAGVFPEEMGIHENQDILRSGQHKSIRERRGQLAKPPL